MLFFNSPLCVIAALLAFVLPAAGAVPVSIAIYIKARSSVGKINYIFDITVILLRVIFFKRSNALSAPKYPPAL